jgi:hypothetical protein
MVLQVLIVILNIFFYLPFCKASETTLNKMVYDLKVSKYAWYIPIARLTTPKKEDRKRRNSIGSNTQNH